MTDPYVIRAATPDDVPALARHRVEMFRDMGVLPEEAYEPLRAATAAFLPRALATGEYLGWVASPAGSTEIVAGSGLLVRRGLPGLRRTGDAVEVAGGPQGLVCNVFTERAWRRRGLGRRMTEAAIAGARAAGVSQLVLHASREGRPIYEALGFVPTNEMRYTGPL